MRWTLVFGCLLVALSSGAFAQTNPAPDYYISALQSVFRFKTEGVRVATQVSPNETIVSLPVEYLRTGILSNDLRLRGGALANYLNAGAPGYYAGRFGALGQSSHDMWCFARRPDNLGAGVRCVVEHGLGRDGHPASIGALDPPNPYFPVDVQVRSSSTMPQPIIAEQPMSFHPDLRAEYVFLGWNEDSARVEIRIGGESMLARGVSRRIARAEDGSATLGLVDGALRLEQSGSDRRGAVITQVPNNAQ